MKYNILGFSQQGLIDLGLDVSDAVLLRELIDFYAGGKMVERDIDGARMFWVKYKTFIEDLPVLGITTTDALQRRLKRIVKAGVLNHKTLKQGGTYSFYSFTKVLSGLLYSDGKSEGVRTEHRTGTDEKSEQNTLLLKDSSTNNINTSLKPVESNKINAVVDCNIPAFSSQAFAEAWKAWAQHRKEMKKTLTPSTTRIQMKKLKDMGEARAIAAINASIGHGWQGIFEETGGLASKNNTQQRTGFSLNDL